jgi:hypothetical protein
MLVDGVCADGHELVCVVQEGNVSGVMVRGSLRAACPRCGGKPYVVLESGVHASSSKIPSERPVAAEEPAEPRKSG